MRLESQKTELPLLPFEIGDPARGYFGPSPTEHSKETTSKRELGPNRFVPPASNMDIGKVIWKDYRTVRRVYDGNSGTSSSATNTDQSEVAGKVRALRAALRQYSPILSS